MNINNTAGEVTALTALVATIMQWVPPGVAVLGLVWWLMKIVIEWDTFVAVLKGKFKKL